MEKPEAPKQVYTKVKKPRALRVRKNRVRCHNINCGGYILG